MLEQIPFNALAWGVGSIACLYFSFKHAYNWLKTRNSISGYFAVSGFAVGIATFFYSFPFFILRSAATLRYGLLLGDLFTYGFLLVLVHIVSSIVLQSKIKFVWLAVPVLAAEAVAWLTAWHQATLTFGDNLFLYRYPDLSAYIQGGLFALALTPLGLYFLYRALKQTGFSARFKSVGLATAYLVGGASVVQTNWVQKNTDSWSSSVLNLIIFTIFLVATLLPARDSQPVKRRSARPV